jgi:hypothetical protein
MENVEKPTNFGNPEIFVFSLIGSQAVLISMSLSAFTKLQTYLRFQSDTSLYPLPHLIPRD